MVTTSRIELLKQKKLLGRAELGIELLEERLASLLDEFKRLVREISVSFDELVDFDREAISILGLAIADEGNLVRDLSKQVDKSTKVDLQSVKVYGLDIPILPRTTPEFKSQTHQFPLSVSSAVDFSAERFFKLYFSYLTYIDQVIFLHRLGSEIRRTRRQIMVLENDITPNLRSAILQIELVLEEREREEQVRLRRFKQTKGRQL